MTDVQVSNARRIGFTALAVVVFWAMAWSAYELGFEEHHNHRFPKFGGWFIASLLLAALPTVLLSLSRSNSLLSRHDQALGFSAAAVVAALAICFRTADSHGRVASGAWARAWIGEPSLEDTVTWAWIILAVALTTALVIFGAWRRAVRDAEVGVAGEDE